jgi:hypothetical protein
MLLLLAYIVCVLCRWLPPRWSLISIPRPSSTRNQFSYQKRILLDGFNKIYHLCLHWAIVKLLFAHFSLHFSLTPYISTFFLLGLCGSDSKISLRNTPIYDSGVKVLVEHLSQNNFLNAQKLISLYLPNTAIGTEG